MRAPQENNLSLDFGRPGTLGDDDPATPILPVHPNKNGDDTIASSPTPQSKRPVLRLDDIEVPSSPPSILGVAGPEACADAINTNEATAQIAGFIDEDEELLPFKIRNMDNALHGEADGNVPPMAHQSLEPAASQNNATIQIELPLNEELEEDLGMGSLLSARHEVAPLAQPLEHSSTTAGLVNALDLSGPDPNHANAKDLMLDAVMEGVGALNETTSDPSEMPAEVALLHEGFDTNFTPQTDGVSSNNEIKGGTVLSDSDHLPEVEMSGLHAPRPTTTTGETEQENGNYEYLPLNKSHSNSPTPDNHDISKKEPDGFADLRSSDIVDSHMRSAAQDSHPDSDEVAMLSASQLSQDLDWHVAFEDRVSHTQTSPEAEVGHPTRKRKRSRGYSSGVKRRRGIGPATVKGTPLVTLPLGAPSQEDTDEFSDCIVVDTTPRGVPKSQPIISAVCQRSEWTEVR